ncbi:lipase maturation factor family protein [Prescottella defluvii]|nr:lipase maturation factor family protein [Prescottella defluvii]
MRGCRDEYPTAESEWSAYEFKGRAGRCAAPSRQFAPYHLRLDWLMWFAAISPATRRRGSADWSSACSSGDAALLKLLHHNPFPDAPPAVIRARLYRYRFTTRDEHRESGAWWARALEAEFLPPVSRRGPP